MSCLKPSRRRSKSSIAIAVRRLLPLQQRANLSGTRVEPKGQTAHRIVSNQQQKCQRRDARDDAIDDAEDEAFEPVGLAVLNGPIDEDDGEEEDEGFENVEVERERLSDAVCCRQQRTAYEMMKRHARPREHCARGKRPSRKR